MSVVVLTVSFMFIMIAGYDNMLHLSYPVIHEDFANFINVSSMVLSTALRASRIKEQATAMASFVSSSVAPGCVDSILVRKASNQVRYLPR